MACYTIQEAKDLWDYAKETYLKIPHPTKGYMDFKELTNRLSDDIYTATGGKRIVPEDIAKLLATPKTVKVASKNLLMTDKNRSSVLSQARAFTSQTEGTPLGKFLSGAYQAPYTAKVIGHGPALHMTHAWPYAFDPARWGDFARTWKNSWKAMSPSKARGFAQEIMLDPRFDEKIKSGLASDPRAIYDDVQERAQFGGWLTHMTKNSFLGLKQLRSSVWDAIYDRVPEYLRTQEMRDLLSTRIDHMTGAPGKAAKLAMSGPAGKTARAIAFAPSLDISRVMRMYDLVHDVTVTGRSLANKLPLMGQQLKKLWGESTPEAKWIARQNMFQWARIGAVITSMLYANQLLLKHFFGSKENINTSDPFKGDWLAGKGPNGRIWQFTGGQVPMLRNLISMVGKPEHAGSTLGNYLMGKLNPALQIPIGLAKGKTAGFRDIPAPFGKAQSDIGDWAEYLTAELGPIATEEGIHEFAKAMSNQNQLSVDENAKFLKAVRNAGLVTIPAVLGTHTYEPKAPASRSHGGRGGEREPREPREKG